MTPSPFDEALQSHRQGRLREAEKLYRAVLAHTPGHFDALHLLGVARQQQGQDAEAIEWIAKALAIHPGSAAAHVNRGAALQGLGRHDEALSAYDQALALKPDFLPALSNRGAALYSLGRYEEALRSHDLAIAKDPNYAEALSNRGNVLQKLGRWEEALASYERAMAVAPGYPQALSNHAVVLIALGRLQEAVASCERALALMPRFAEALFNRGNALRALGQAQAALTSYGGAIAANPAYAEAFFNQANLLLEMRRHESAARSYARVLELGQEYPYALGSRLQAQMFCCDWSGHADSVSRVVEAVRAGKRADMPFSFFAVSNSAADQLQCARVHAAHEYPATTPLWRGERYQHDRIRVAYLSATFHDHAVSRLIAGLLEAHDKTRFEISGISFGPDDDSEIRRRIRHACDEFVDVRGKHDRDVAQLLREREIDIAVDLNGYTGRESRPGVLALRPVPVQVSYLGFAGTMGAPYVDYIVADSWLIAPAEARFYQEKVVRLPYSYQPNDRKRQVAELTPSRAESGLPDTGFVFCCFNNSYKITPEMFTIWMRLLDRVEGSVLWFREDDAAATRNLRQQAQKHGIEPQRLVFAPRTGALAQHLARYRLADLFLDTLPFNAHVTASDALWVGLPLLTCTGTTLAGRVAGSLLHATGMAELITPDLRAYESLALELATDPPRLAAIREKLARARDTAPLFDTAMSCRHLEAAYAAMWQRHQSGLAPESFDVPAVE